jgi:hypothetical protein
MGFLVLIWTAGYFEYFDCGGLINCGCLINCGLLFWLCMLWYFTYMLNIYCCVYRRLCVWVS